MPPPRGGGALLRNLSDNYAHSGASLSGQNATENLTPEEQAKAELDANILAGGGLGLDPENDPIVYTTDWGLDIKFHNDWGSFGTSTNSGGVAGYCYFTMGSYGGTAVNWVIIGRATNVAQRLYFNGSYSSLGTKYGSYTASDYPNHTAALPNSAYYKNNVYETSTDAGSTIVKAASKGLVYDMASVLLTNSVANAEITSGSVLCLSEKVLYNTTFHLDPDDDKNCLYHYSNLLTNMTNLYSSSLGFSSTHKSKIQKQTLKTAAYYLGSPGMLTLENQYLFPLAYHWEEIESSGNKIGTENFSIYTYLGTDDTTGTKTAYMLGGTTATPYFLRTGSLATYRYVFGIWSTGKWTNLYTYVGSDTAYGVRPAFVLKIT